MPRPADPNALKTRMLRAWCRHCGYSLRISRKWLAVACPKCPNPHCRHRGLFLHTEAR